MKDADLNVQGPRLIPPLPGVRPFTEYRHSSDELRALDRGFDLVRTEAYFKGLRSLGDVTILHFLTHWTLDGFDVGYPRFELAGRFREHNGVLARLGIRPMAYVNIRRACSDPAFDWWREHDGARGAIVDASGTPVNAPLRNVPFAIMAPGGSMWQSWLREKCATLVRDHGLPGLYLDEAAAMGSFANFRELDGRPAGASGQAWNEDSRSLCRTIKAAGRKYNPDFFTAGEAVSEIYLDAIDGNLLYGYSRHREDAIPFSHAVYHDYTVCLGRTVGKWTDSYLETRYPEGERRGDTTTGEFVARFAQAAAWGDVIGSVRGDIMDYSPPAGAFLKKLVFLRHAFPDYLKWGELLDYRDGGFPGAEPVPVRMAAWSPGTLPSDIPVASVLASAWRSPARKAVGIFLVNVTASPRTVRLPLDAQRLGVAPGPLAVRVTDGAGSVRTLPASDTLTLDLPGETPVFCILER